jgi:hypothetical protein
LETSKFIIVLPVEIHENGETLVKNVLHHSRKKRDDDDEFLKKNVFYRVDLEGEPAILELTLREDLTPSSFTIEFWSHQNVTKEKYSGKASKCHYHGQIKGKNSDIALRKPVPNLTLFYVSKC